MTIILSMAIVASAIYTLYCAEKIQKILNSAKEDNR